MKIEKGTMVSVTYELKYDNADASLIEKVEKDNEVVPELTLSAPKPARRQNIAPTVLYPEIKTEYRTNFKIEDYETGPQIKIPVAI